MKTDQLQKPAPIFAQIVSLAIGRLKKRLQHYYQKAYPDSGEIIRRMIDEEEAKAWEISFFPHLILPDLVDARIGKLGLQPDETRYDTAGLSSEFHYARNAEDRFRFMRVVKLVLRRPYPFVAMALLILLGAHLSKDRYPGRVRRLAVHRPLARSL